MSQEESKSIPAMGLESKRIKEYLIGDNKYIDDINQMIKTPPPSEGSNFLNLSQTNPVFDYFTKTINGVQLMAVGPFTEEDLGVKCYHSKTGSVELVLNHLIDKKNQYVLVDMTAGADSFASGLFTRFDITFLVVEPTLKSIQVYEQYKEYAKQFNICIRVIGNKVEDQSDIDFIKKYVGSDLIASFSQSKFIRNMEKGNFSPISELEENNINALNTIIDTINNQEKDWDKYYQQAIEFHNKNALSWGNRSTNSDLTLKSDPSFSLKEIAHSM
jgi:CO dehydrogenase maturation factor